jgi:AhpD family alkylhydroperoxidase
MNAPVVDDSQGGVHYVAATEAGRAAYARSPQTGERITIRNIVARIRHVDQDKATSEAKTLLDGVQDRLGMTPNMMKVMAASPAVLGGYLSLSAALAGGTLDKRFRQQIALAVAQANNSRYGLSLQTAIAKRMGMNDAEILASRQSRSDDAKQDAGLKFVTQLVTLQGQVSEEAVRRVRAAGYSDAEMAEIVANVALTLFTNYFNHVAGTEEQDHPKVSPASKSSA